MLENMRPASGFASLVLAVNLCAQQPQDPLAKLHTLGLPEADGSVPVVYVSSQKERAVRLQKSLEAAHSWFEKQLQVKVPIELAVLDAEMWPKISSVPNGMPFSSYASDRGLVVLPGVSGDQGQGQPGADREHSPGGVLQGEHVLFHEDGHIFAALMKIRSGNEFVNELLAGVFMTGYISAERPDLNWRLENVRTRPWRNQTTLPRYTTLADLDYIYNGVGADNYYWFQYQLERVADFLVKDQSFPAVIEKFQAAFPAAKAKQETLDEIDAHLESIRPGFKKMAGPLLGPSTITRIMPSACQEPKTLGNEFHPIVFQNDTAAPLVFTAQWGKTFEVPPHSWRSYRFAVGTSLKLPAGTCLLTVVPGNSDLVDTLRVEPHPFLLTDFYVSGRSVPGAGLPSHSGRSSDRGAGSSPSA